MKQYFIQAIGQLKQHPLISIISIIGTALAIFLIMIVVMVTNIGILPFSPESNRDRFLHTTIMSMRSISSSESDMDVNNGPMSMNTINELYKSLKTPEYVTAYSAFPSSIVASLPGQTSVNVEMRETDSEYFKVFDHKFIEGKPYSKSDVDSHIPLAVITELTARSLFGKTNGIIGKEILLNYAACKVVGVVKDVSILANIGFSNIWVPYGTITPNADSSWGEGAMGSFSATILAKSKDDFPIIMAECNRKLEEYNKVFASIGYKLVSRNRPYYQEKEKARRSMNEPNVGKVRTTEWTIYLILLLVPAINLASMTQSRLRQRVIEIGVRRAFGCNKLQLFSQIIIENLIVTIVAGAIGLILSILFAKIMTSDFFQIGWNPAMVEPEIDFSILFQSKIFAYALLFCFILNIMSCGIPAWKASRSNIVRSLEGNIH